MCWKSVSVWSHRNGIPPRQRLETRLARQGVNRKDELSGLGRGGPGYSCVSAARGDLRPLSLEREWLWSKIIGLFVRGYPCLSYAKTQSWADGSSFQLTAPNVLLISAANP